jgi:hypothetical protein
MALMDCVRIRDFALPRRLGKQGKTCEYLKGQSEAEGGHERME